MDDTLKPLLQLKLLQNYAQLKKQLLIHKSNQLNLIKLNSQNNKPNYKKIFFAQNIY